MIERERALTFPNWLVRCKETYVIQGTPDKLLHPHEPLLLFPSLPQALSPQEAECKTVSRAKLCHVRQGGKVDLYTCRDQRSVLQGTRVPGDSPLRCCSPVQKKHRHTGLDARLITRTTINNPNPVADFCHPSIRGRTATSTQLPHLFRGPRLLTFRENNSNHV
ncbi:hypothetical protein BDP55DRAFT_262445 [Colletotrichum godetiae]|uniref:Uncharacterized protein n=1 Tax=Colletotrichum godetiae TaxID=1209918 RepID=A0AAJ0EYS0_9PEZI|nr:uncharacterized protein BDP55DRAFT_262445 [Colletotrichum godetiae]KAK1691345.1 hypothetical protein BDP55DRAFT_262445 [Colletotrichum godetiae]